MYIVHLDFYANINKSLIYTCTHNHASACIRTCTWICTYKVELQWNLQNKDTSNLEILCSPRVLEIERFQCMAYLQFGWGCPRASTPGADQSLYLITMTTTTRWMLNYRGRWSRRGKVKGHVSRLRTVMRYITFKCKELSHVHYTLPSHSTCTTPYHLTAHAPHPTISQYMHYTLPSRSTRTTPYHLAARALRPTISQHMHYTPLSHSMCTTPHPLTAHALHPTISQYMHYTLPSHNTCRFASSWCTHRSIYLIGSVFTDVVSWMVCGNKKIRNSLLNNGKLHKLSMRCMVKCTPIKVLQPFCWPMTPFHHWPTLWSPTTATPLW